MRNLKSSRRKPQISRKKWPPGKATARERSSNKKSNSGRTVKIRTESHSFLKRKETTKETAVRPSRTLTMKNGRKKTTLTTTMPMTSGSKKMTISRIGSSQKVKTMMVADSKDLEAEAVKGSLLVKTATNLYAPMAPNSPEKL